MAANNEIGVLQPVAEIGRLCRERGVLCHSDAAQAGGRIALRVDELNVDLLSLSGHKLYGPKGVGVLFVRARRPRARILARQFGGGHERGLRSGTLPVPLIVGMARALELCLEEMAGRGRRLRALRDRLWRALASELPDAALQRRSRSRACPATSTSAFAGVDGERLLLALRDIAVSSGAACSSASPEPSHVLRALGLPVELARASLRFGLGRGTTQEEIDVAARSVIAAVREQRA